MATVSPSPSSPHSAALPPQPSSPSSTLPNPAPALGIADPPSNATTPSTSSPPPETPPPATPPPVPATPPPATPPPVPATPPPATPPPVPATPPATPPPVPSTPAISSSPPPPTITTAPSSPPAITPPPSDAPPPPTPLSPPPPPPVSLPPPPHRPLKETPPPPLPTTPPSSSPPPPLSSSPPPPHTPPLDSPPPAAPSTTPPSTPPPTTPPPTSPPSTPENSPPPLASPPPTPSSSPPSSSPPPPAAAPPRTSSSPPVAISPPASHASPSHPSPASPIPIPSSANTTGTNPSSSASPSSGHSDESGGSSNAIVAVGIVVGVVIIGLILFAVWRLRKGRRRLSGFDGEFEIGSSLRSDSNLITKTTSGDYIVGSGSGSNFSRPDHGGLGHSRSWFTYEELFEATDGFSVENLLGEGGFGPVYKGCLPNGREVAVKQLKIGGGQGEREFKAEVEIISRIHHRHLVSLVGYCVFESRRLLVYDYLPNNTLYYHLHREGSPVMGWTRRFKIASGAARGIAYLHEDCHPRIIHRDIKSSNILLDDKFEARVSDFGLAKLALDADTHVSTRVMGTFGYMAPEYATSGKLSEKSDVYSFGVVLLEIIAGRKPVDASEPDEGLVEWARPRLSHALDTGEFEGLVDPRLGKNYVEDEVYRMIEAAAACVRHSSAKRPQMGQIVRALDSVADSDLNNGMRVGESQMYNSAQQSAEIRWFRRMAFGSQDCSTDFFSDLRNLGFSSQGSQSGDSSTQGSRIPGGISRPQSQDIPGISRQERQNPYYSSQGSSDPARNIGLSSQGSRSGDSSSTQGSRIPGISRQQSQDISGISRQERQNP